MENKPGDVNAQTETADAPTSAKTATPSRKRYSRAQLMHFRDTIDLTAPPVGYNPAILKPVEPLNKDMPPMARDGMKWNRSRSLRDWAPQNQGSKGGMPFSRLAEGEDMPNGPLRGGRALRSAISWNEQHSGSLPAAEKGFARRNSRSDAPGRWDNNKDEPLSKSMEKGGPEKWKSYGHRDNKEKVPPKLAKEEECTDNPPQEMAYHGHEPEWMYHRPSTENPERMKQHRQFAADFEEERKLMREKIAKENKERNTERGESSLFMTDEEINDYKKELEAEERGMSSSAFTFDSLKEALKSQGVSNLPPMPTSGISTVDQIEKSLKASASAQQQQQQRVSVSELGRRQLELLKAVGAQTGGVPNPTAPANIEGANRLLSMLRGQVRPTGSFGNMNPATQLQQPLAGFPMNLPQQQNLFSGNNPQLERLFAANARPGGNLGLPTYGAQQPQVHPGMGNVPSIPFMQQAGHLNQRGAQQQNNLLSALLANQQAQNVHQKQAQMMAQLRQAQQQTALQAVRAESEAPAAGGHESGEDDGESKGNAASGPVPQGMLGLLPGVGGNVQNPAPLSFGLQGNLMGARQSMPTGPGMFNPPVGNIPIGGNPQDALFPGGMPPAINPAGLGGHHAFLMQNGGGLARPMGPGLAGLNLPGVRPGMGGALGHLMDDRQLPGLNSQPNAIHASLLAAQQNSGGSLNRFFGENNVGAPGAFSADPPTVAPVRNRSLEELKNEAQ